jgi:2-haloacid dehalogenase
MGEAAVDLCTGRDPHADVRPARDRQQETGLALVALTNSPLRVVQDQLAYAGLTECFAAVFSADQVRAPKPRPEPYRLVAERSQVAVGDVRLVAAHAWDVAGALAAGCSAAFVERPGKVLAPLGDRPDIVGGDLLAVADRIAAVDGI